MRAFLNTIIFALIFLLSGVGITYAAGTDLVTFTTTPKSPGALEKITVSIESFAVDLNSANIVWNVDKEFVKDGIAEKTIAVTTPDFGKEMIIDVIIMTATGDKIDKQFIIAPGEVDLLWEAQTYTPPFYKGKALPSVKSLVRVTAIPRFEALSSEPSKYYYKWTYNRTMDLGEALGKNSATFPMGFFENSRMPVSVSVSLPGTAWKGVKNVNVSAVFPKIAIYERNPLLGVRFGKAVDGKTLTSEESEVSLFATPYFFSLEDVNLNRLVYTWETNRTYTAPGLYPKSLTILNNSVATNTVTIHIQNAKRVLQEARSGLTLSFAAE